tara:strand:- start:45 stop:218 length:174 start_codon:yes stop_codon:yes gene_type:complete
MEIKNFKDTIDYDGMGNQGRIGRQVQRKKDNTNIIVKYLGLLGVLFILSIILIDANK